MFLKGEKTLKVVRTLAAVAFFILALALLSDYFGKSRQLFYGAHLLGGDNDFQKITGEDSATERVRWNTLLKSRKFFYDTTPVSVVVKELHRIPKGSKILVTPLEEGRNAVFLAQKGYQVTGIDFSETAILRAKKMAKEKNTTIEVINADLNEFTPEPNSYDAVFNVDLHLPKWAEAIKIAVKPGGIVVYEAEVRPPSALPENVPIASDLNDVSPKEMALRPGMLKTLFKDFEILSFEETADSTRGLVATLVARKPIAPKEVSE